LTPEDRAAPASGSRALSIAFFVLIGLHVLPIWVFRTFPSQDGPEHIANARLLLLYGAPGSTRIRQFYEFNEVVNPTWFGSLVLAGLLEVLRNAALTEKLVLTGYLVLLPLAARRALAALGEGGEASAFLVFPLLCTYTYHMGFFTFSYSLAVFFFFLAFWARHWPDFSAGQTIALTALATLLFCCHVVTFALAALTVAAASLARSASQPGRPPFRSWRPMLAFLPGALWTALLIPRQSRFALTLRPDWDLRALLEGPSSLVSYRADELPVFQALAALVLAVAAAAAWSRIRGRRQSPREGFLAVWALFLLAAWKAPTHVGLIWLVPERMALFVFFGAMLWLAAGPLPRAAAIVCVAGSCVLSLWLLALHVRTYRAFEGLLDEYGAATRLVSDDSVLLPLTFAPQGSVPEGPAESERVQPMRHAAARIGWSRPIVELANYQARLPVFPLRFRRPLDPYEQIGPIEALPVRLDFATYPARTGATIDFVLVWGLSQHLLAQSGDAQAILDQIDAGFVPVHRSEHLTVYRRRSP
jgi:hypothetical protein